MKGFVFGKYLPFHNGHKALIDFALTKCSFLHIVVCASDKENTDIKIRAKWINETYQNQKNIKVIELKYNETKLPNTSVSSINISKKWSIKFLEILPQVDVLITSEDYGDYVSDFMKIKHILFDKTRFKVPISAFEIRKSIYENWSFLPDVVKKTYQKKLVFSGTECSGKSSISKAISEHFNNSSVVEEVGRQIIANSNSFSQKQLYEIAHRHSENIKVAINELKPFVFIDTDVYITQSYAKYFFNEYLKLAEWIYQFNKADFVFYLTKDLKFEQDGTRLTKNERSNLDLSHRNTLKHFDIVYSEIEGNWEDRFITIVNKIQQIKPIYHI